MNPAEFAAAAADAKTKLAERVDAQKKELDRGLDPDCVRKVNKGGSNLSYVPGWYVIGELNRIFGFDGWEIETQQLDHKGYKRTGKEGKEGVAVSVVARVLLLVRFADGVVVRRAGVGAGSHVVYSGDWGDAYEKAVKEADTDALKRAARTLGNRFGLSLYDKDNALHKGGEDAHGVDPEPEPEPPEPPKPGELTPRARVDAIITELLELGGKLDKNMPSQITAWLDGQIKDIDRLNTDDMRRLVGTKREPGVLVTYGRELRKTLNERNAPAPKSGYGSGAPDDTYGT